jgi:K+-sensing histidine kinase KdpD
MSLDAELHSGGTGNAFRRWMTPIAVSLALVALTTVLLWLLKARPNREHLIFIYFVPTALIAIRYGCVSAMCVTIASSFAAAFFLYPPRFSFQINNPLDILELGLFSLLALLASQVVAGFANDSEIEKRRKRAPIPLRRRWPALTAFWDRIRSI